jgi:M6 family metalloprotease-like protein
VVGCKLNSRRRWVRSFALIAALLLIVLLVPVGAEQTLIIRKSTSVDEPDDSRPIYPCMTSRAATGLAAQLPRKHPWSLPTRPLSADFQRTLNVLVLRFNFQKEDIDDPNTTGNGLMNLADLPMTAEDSAAYLDSVKHFIDPPPHDSAYFDAHMRALSKYWETVSEGKITLVWDIYPPGKDSIYQLPHPMSYYGKCSLVSDTIVAGLEQFFLDCIRMADSVSPELQFADYDAIILFHAGSDRQNDLGNPETCSDLFTGFIHYFPDPERGLDTAWVDNGSYFVETALIAPESPSQDNRAVALNAVLAHEFGHQLGLVDLYNTRSGISQLGDFALMDYNGFGSGVETEWPAGRIFGASPVYASAWSRAYLGFVEVHDFRQGSDIRVVAAEVVSEGIKIARVPITENEYYLIENRVALVNPADTFLLLDSVSSVILWPVNENKEFTGEYDFLMPGSGLLIYHVDEGVAALDYDGDGVNNFDDNDLQWDSRRRFIRLIEADGIVNFGGYYRVGGYGEAEDMFRDDRNNSFTPNTNPPAIDNSGNNTHIYITNITRGTVNIGGVPMLLDTVILFDLETDKLAAGFPVRAGYPTYGLSPLADDLDRDGIDELIVASGQNLLVMTTAGENFLRRFTNCTSCPVYYDTSQASVYPAPGRLHPLPLFAKVNDDITAGPVTGDFGDNQSLKYVAIGYPTGTEAGRVMFYQLDDANEDGLADSVTWFNTNGYPIALSFGDIFYVLTSRGAIYRKDNLIDFSQPLGSVGADRLHGICRLGDGLLLLAGDSLRTKLYYFDAARRDSFTLGNHYYNFGPVLVDMNLDDLPELAAFSPDGRGILATIDTTGQSLSFSILQEAETGFHMTTNPIAGDVDSDGYPDLIVGGTNAVYAFDHNLLLKTDFPIFVNDRFPDDDVVAAPVMADIESGGRPEVIFPTFVGNIYSFGASLSFGFPLSGGERGAGSPVVFSDTSGGKLGYLGADGWFYAWDIDLDTTRNYWPMGGHDPAGTFAFDQTKLGEPSAYAVDFPKEQFYNYPNPVVDGVTRLRYFLGRDAERVEFHIYDLIGQEVVRLTGDTEQGQREKEWACSGVTPGVYRCVIQVDFGDRTETAFTDIAIIR